MTTTDSFKRRLATGSVWLLRQITSLAGHRDSTVQPYALRVKPKLPTLGRQGADPEIVGTEAIQHDAAAGPTPDMPHRSYHSENVEASSDLSLGVILRTSHGHRPYKFAQTAG